MRPRSCAIGWIVLGIAVAGGVSAHAQPASAPAEINAPFEKADVRQFVSRFETESREVYARREAITQALGLRAGMAVADIGAGTGLFTRLFADRVGPSGVVYAVDISKPFLKHIEAQARRSGQTQVKTILGSQDSANLPPNSIDLAFLCDTYHHFEHPAQELASIYRALRSDGRLVVVDFDRDRASGKDRDFIRKHVRAGKSVFRGEIERAGFRRIDVRDAPALQENFFLAFAKVEAPDRARDSTERPPAGRSGRAQADDRSSP
jgi:predicted methyltransferase